MIRVVGLTLPLEVLAEEELVLIRWTKGFGAPNIEGRDVTAMFASSLEKYVGLPD